MTDNNLLNVVQIATGLAVVVGLIMVFIELRQAKALSLAELTSQAYTESLADLRTIMGEDAAVVIARACESPGELEPQELVILDAYYHSKIAQITRLRVLEFVADFGVPWQAVAQQQLPVILNNEPGRRWFENHAPADPELYTIGQDLLQAGGLECNKQAMATMPQLDT